MEVLRRSARACFGLLAPCMLLGGCYFSQQPGAPAGSHPAPMPVAMESHRPAAPRQHLRAPLYLPGSSTQQLVSYDVVNGMAIMEGDILLGPANEVPLRFGLPRLAATNVRSAVALANREHLWPGSTIPYAVDASVKPATIGFINWAVQHMNTTSLKLRPRTASDRDYVVFRDSGEGSGCSSYLGRIGGAQEIEVADCGQGSIVHEVLHAAGFYHEQSRGDRDGFITIAWDEISPSYRSQFDKRDGRGQDIGAYDFGSIMHYSSRAFSRTGNATIIPKIPGASIGQREGLSTGDRAALEELYGAGGGATPSPGPAPVPGPTPAPGPTPSPQPVASGFAGSYRSSRGDVSCTQNGSTVSCQYPGGAMFCAANGAQLDCGWTGGGQGRAVFQRQASGVLAGTYGDFFSSNSRGQWDLIPANASPAPSPSPPPPSPSPSPSGAASLSGTYSSSRGPMSCTENVSTLACTFQDNGVHGRVDCVKDQSGLQLSCTWGTLLPPGSGRASLRRASVSERNLTGTWGHFAADSGGGTWEMRGL